MGKIHDEEDFKKTVVFKYGCFGYGTVVNFIAYNINVYESL